MRTATILVVLLLAPGCALFEDAGKLATTAAVAALKAELPALTHSILDEAKALADKGVEEATVFAAQQGARAAQAGILLVAREAGLDPQKFDTDSDGKLSDAELTVLISAIQSQEKIPLWVQLLAGSGGLGLLLTGAKTGNRYLKDKWREEVKAVVKAPTT